MSMILAGSYDDEAKGIFIEETKRSMDRGVKILTDKILEEHQPSDGCEIMGLEKFLTLTSQQRELPNDDCKK